MLKTLMEKIEITTEISLIKKHFRIAKKHNSNSELEKVKYELLDLQGKLIKEKRYSENTNNDIFNLLSEVNNYQLKTIPCADAEW